QVEAEPGAADVARLRAHDPAEACEQPAQVSAWDPDPAVADADGGPVLGALDPAQNLAALRRVLGRVVEQVAEDRLQEAGVGQHLDLLQRYIEEDAVARARQGAERGHHALGLGPQVEALQTDVDLMVFEAGSVE